MEQQREWRKKKRTRQTIIKTVFMLSAHKSSRNCTNHFELIDERKIHPTRHISLIPWNCRPNIWFIKPMNNSHKKHLIRISEIVEIAINFGWLFLVFLLWMKGFFLAWIDNSLWSRFEIQTHIFVCATCGGPIWNKSNICMNWSGCVCVRTLSFEFSEKVSTFFRSLFKILLFLLDFCKHHLPSNWNGMDGKCKQKCKLDAVHHWFSSIYGLIRNNVCAICGDKRERGRKEQERKRQWDRETVLEEK